MDLILGFYKPQQGTILGDKHDLNDIALILRSKIIVLEQQARIFNDMIYNNVAFGQRTDLAAVQIVCCLV